MGFLEWEIFERTEIQRLYGFLKFLEWFDNLYRFQIKFKKCLNMYVRLFFSFPTSCTHKNHQETYTKQLNLT